MSSGKLTTGRSSGKQSPASALTPAMSSGRLATGMSSGKQSPASAVAPAMGSGRLTTERSSGKLTPASAVAPENPGPGSESPMGGGPQNKALIVFQKEIEAKCKSAKDTGAIDLHGNSMLEVPSPIFGVAGLRRLLLHNNLISLLPADISVLTNLSVLYLQENRLIDLPGQIGMLRNLQTLALHNNKLKYIPAEIGLCESLQVLSLAKNELTDVPLELGDCRDMKSIELKDNPDLQVPPVYVVHLGPSRVAEYFLKFGSSKHGERVLELSKMKLRGFPIEITYVGRYLRRLELSGNATLHPIPYEICELTRLEILNMEGCKIAGRLTQGFGFLTSLTQVSLASNEIVAVPVGLGNATRITNLNLDRNWTMRLPPKDVQSRGFPSNFEFLQKLCEAEKCGILDLKGLKLTTVDFFEVAVCSEHLQVLPEPIENGHPWDHLVALDLSSNRIANLVDVVCDMTNLVTLLCSSNQLTEMPDGTTKLLALKHLRLDDNNFSVFPSIVCFGDSGNQIEEQKDVGFEVAHLGISRYDVKTVWGPGEPHPSLQYLDLSNNKLPNISKHLPGLTKLKLLRISNNKIGKIPPNFVELRALEELDLAQNEFAAFPVELFWCGSLKKLFIGSNKLSALPPSIAQLTGLEELDISYNIIQTLPVEIGKLTKLKVPTFRGNKLEGVPANLLRGGDAAIFAFWKGMCESMRTKVFDISNSGMVDLPAQLGTMTWLTELNISRNQLVRLGPQVGELTLVRSLNLAHNRITHLPGEIGLMTNLRSIDITGNNIRALPLELGFCVELREIHMDESMVVMPSRLIIDLGVRSVTIYLRRLFESNKSGKLGLTGMGLINIPKEVFNMVELKEIHVDKNKISDIENEVVFFDELVTFSANLNQIGDLNFLLGDARKSAWEKQRLSSLTSLRLRGNQIQVIPGEITRLKALKVLLLENNLLSSLPTEIGHVVNLESFSCARNQIESLPDSLSNLVELKLLDISGNKIWKLPFALGRLQDLNQFHYKNNPIREPPVEITRMGQDAILSYLDSCNLALLTNTFECTSVALYDIPKEVCAITQLTRLDISDNKIAGVRADLASLTKLEFLDLSENNLRLFPPLICDLTLLAVLNLSHNAITRLPLELGRLTLLRRLGLEGLRLIQPAKEVAVLSAPGVVKYLRKYHRVAAGSTHRLDISSVGLASFPREIALLGTALQTLSIDGNKIMDLTEELGALQQLRVLVASKNQLLGLPIEIGLLTDLQTLQVSHNNISALPNVIHLENLTVLDVSHNSIVSLPNNMKRWSNLKTLIAHHNSLVGLPDGIGENAHLITMDVADNKIRSLPPSFGHLSRLSTLNATNNAMTWLPNEVAQVTSLTSLQIAGNRILALPPGLSLCTSITALEVAWSHLIVPPAETHSGGISTMFSYLQALHLAQFEGSLHLEKWNLQAFPLDGTFLTSLTYLNLQFNQLRVMPSVLGLYQRMVHLRVDSNLLETLPEQIHMLHGSLSELSVSRNNLVRLPKGLWKLTSLISLNLNRNHLSSIPDQFSSLTMLRYLYLDYNKINLIPEAFGSLSRLQELHLEENPIRYVSSASFFNCKSLRELKVEVQWMDDLAAWRKDLTMYSAIASHGVRFPPTEVLMMGADAIWKYLVVVSSSRKSLSLDLSRVVFWMLLLEDGHQRFYSWPIDVSYYDHLHRLNLAGNFLTKIPDTVSKLTNLVELDLEQNRLKSLPLALAWCTALERLMLLRNPDLQSPGREITSKGSAGTLGYLACLHTAETAKRIHFEGSSYRRVPDEFMQMGHVTDLSVARNAIEIIPGEIMFMTSLKALCVDHNQLALLPDELCLLSQLQTLSCEFNLLVAMPDEVSRLVSLRQLKASHNFMGDPPPEIEKHGPHHILDYFHEFKKGRITGNVDLSNFELSDIPLEAVYIDRPLKWTRFGADRYIRVFTDDLNKRWKRKAQEAKDQELRALRASMGLDEDLIEEFNETDAIWDPLSEFCEDAVIEQGPYNTQRRRDRLRTLDDFYDSFTEWYAFALGYNSLEEMDQNKNSDEDVRKKPDDIQLYDFIQTRFGPPELEPPCRWCVELGEGCVELEAATGRKRRHKGMHKAARCGWYNTKLRRKHGPQAAWSDDDEDSSEDSEGSDDFEEGLAKPGFAFEDDEDGDNASEASSVQYKKKDRKSTLKQEEEDPVDDSDTLTGILSGGSHKYVKSLNLHNNLITHLPKEISKLRHLLFLRLSHNILSLLPGTMGKLKSLTYLNLAGNRVSHFPDEMSALVSLKTLDIRRNEFKTLPDAIENYTNLTKLAANENHLITISSVLGECQLLEELWVQDNKLTAVHPLVGNLDRLNTLNLGNNAISSIPPQIGNCVALTQLGIYGNGLARLPPSLKKLKYLKRLMVNNNVLLDVPETIMFMHELEGLYFNNNEVSSLEGSLCKVVTLKTLIFQHNYLESLPPDIQQLTALTELRLDNNTLYELCPELGQLTELKMLQLSNNQLKTLPPELCQLSNLTKLSLDSNDIQELPEDFGSLVSLQRLWLDDNAITAFPDSMGELTSLTELHVDSNRLYELCDTFSRLTNLLELFMHKNFLGHAKVGELGQIIGTAMGVPEGVCGLVGLRVLSIAGNDLDSSMLPTNITRLTNLTELWMQDNNFEMLPAEICHLPKLRYILMDAALDAIHPTDDFFRQQAFPPEAANVHKAAKQMTVKMNAQRAMLDKMLGKKR